MLAGLSLLSRTIFKSSGDKGYLVYTRHQLLVVGRSCKAVSQVQHTLGCPWMYSLTRGEGKEQENRSRMPEKAVELLRLHVWATVHHHEGL